MQQCFCCKKDFKTKDLKEFESALNTTVLFCKSCFQKILKEEKQQNKKISVHNLKKQFQYHLSNFSQESVLKVPIKLLNQMKSLGITEITENEWEIALGAEMNYFFKCLDNAMPLPKEKL